MTFSRSQMRAAAARPQQPRRHLREFNPRPPLPAVPASWAGAGSGRVAFWHLNESMLPSFLTGVRRQETR